MSALKNYLDESEITQVKAIHIPKEYNNEIQAFQDLLIYALKGISMYANKCRKLNIINNEIDLFTEKTLKQTYVITTTDPSDIAPLLAEAVRIRSRAKRLYEWTCIPNSQTPTKLEGPASFHFDTKPYNIGVQAQIISFERTLRAGSTTHIFLEDICLLELTDLLENSKAPELNVQSDGTTHTLVHQVLSTLANNPSMSQLTLLADQLSGSEVRSDQNSDQVHKDPETLPNLKATISVIPQTSPTPLRPTMNIRKGRK